MVLHQIPSRSMSPTVPRRVRNTAPIYDYMSRNNGSKSRISEASRHNFSATELDRLRSQMQALHASITDLQEAVGQSKSRQRYRNKKPNSCNLATFPSQKLLWGGGAANSLDGTIPNRHRRGNLHSEEKESSSEGEGLNSDFQPGEEMDNRFEVLSSNRLSPVRETREHFKMSPQTMPDMKGYYSHDFRTFGVHSLHAVSDNENEVDYEANHENNTMTEDESETPGMQARMKELEEELSQTRQECEEKNEFIKLLESSKHPLEVKISLLEQENFATQKSNSKLHTEKEHLEDSVKKITRDIAVLRQVASELSDELESERKKSADGAEELKKLQLQNMNLKTILSKLRNYKKCVKCKSPNTGLHSSSESTAASSKDIAPEPRIAPGSPQLAPRKTTPMSKVASETKKTSTKTPSQKEEANPQPVVKITIESPTLSQSTARNPSPLFLPRDIRAASPPKLKEPTSAAPHRDNEKPQGCSKLKNVLQTHQESVASTEPNVQPLHFSVLPVHSTAAYQPVPSDEVDVAVASFTNSRCNKIILTRARKNSYLFGRLPIQVFLSDTRPAKLLAQYKGCSLTLLKFVELHEDSEYHYFTKTLTPRPSSPRLTGISRPAKDVLRPIGTPSKRPHSIEAPQPGRTIAPRARRQAHRFGSSGTLSSLSSHNLRT